MKSRRHRSIGVVLCLTACGLGSGIFNGPNVSAQTTQQLQPGDGSISGDLEPDQQELSQDPCFRNRPGNDLELLFGSNGAISQTFPQIVIGTGTKSFLVMDRNSQGSIEISGSFQSAPGYPQAIIKDNHWDIDADRIDHFVKTRHRLTVTTAFGQTVLDVYYLNSHVVELTGQMYVGHTAIDLSKSLFGGATISDSCAGSSYIDVVVR